MQLLAVSIPLAPLFGAIVAGLFGGRIGDRGAHGVAIAAVGWSLLASALVAWDIFQNGPSNTDWFVWTRIEGVDISIGFLADNLTATMMLVVTFVSLMVHIYTVGYMAGDPGYARFFSYINFFTFAMLALVMANNFLQLFFGWEAVGLASYLLIGFWHTRPSAIHANLKAFLVNRVGDFGFLIGVGLVLAYFGTLDYAEVFAASSAVAAESIEIFPGLEWAAITVICIALFVGAMGKSAQFPLHVWLPDSMEGPTPISALIHAATMVTAGIFMVARMSPLFELSEAALTFVLFIGAITAFFMALLGLVQHDIKRVVAYSTLSQLGYMTAALGASAYSAAIFHLVTHAFFKALLFLAAGSVIIAMHHEQDMRKMGGLKKWMPITYWTAIVGSLALAGAPPFAGFFSKDAIIESIRYSELPGAQIVHWTLIAAAFITALYSFRLLFLVFHGAPRMNEKTRLHLRESPKVVTIPLLLLAIPSAIAGWLFIDPMLFGDFFEGAIKVLPQNDSVGAFARAMGGGGGTMLLHSYASPALWLAFAGAAVGYYCYLANPELPSRIAGRMGWVYRVLLRKYGIDEFNEWFFAGGARGLGGFLWKKMDAAIIDGFFVNGTARLIDLISRFARRLQTGYIYHYAFTMIIGVALILFWRLVR